MRYDPIRITDIQKRQQRVASSGADKTSITEATICITKDESNRQYMIEHLFSLCNNTESAEKCMPFLVKFINEASGNHLATLLNYFSNSIAPVIENNDMVLNELKNIESDAKRKICVRAITDNMAIDRILENHDKLSKRFNMQSYVLEHNVYEDPFNMSRQICEWIDTYDMPGYAKLQTAIEEVNYLFQNNGVKYDSKDILQDIVEYFMISEVVNADTVKLVLSQNKVVSKEDTENIRYVFGEYASDGVISAIEKFKTEEKANESLFNKTLNAIYTKSPEQIIDDTPNILAWFRQLVVLSTLGINPILGAVNIAVDAFIKMDLNRKQVEKISKFFKAEKEKTTRAIEKSNGDKKEDLQKYSDSLDNAISKIDMHRDKLFTYDEIIKQDQVENEVASNIPVTLDEFNSFKFDKVVNTAMDASNYITKNYDKAASKANANIKRSISKPSKKDEDVDKDGNAIRKSPTPINPALQAGLKSISSHFTESLFNSNINIFDAVLVTFDVSESKAEEIYDLMNGICEDVGNRYGKDGAKFYTNTVGDNCEIHLIDPTPVMLTENEKRYLPYFSESDKDILMEYYNLVSLIEAYVGYEPETILTDLLKKDIGFEEAYMVMDMVKYSGLNETDDVWNKLIDKYTNKSYDSNDYQKINENTMINNLEYEFNDDVNIPFDIQVEACGLMRGIVNEAFDTSSVKVALQGMKSKVKNLGVKEKEISKNMDVAASGLMRSVENALTNDRREAIIKGSIIPSFSKCIKTVIGAGAVAVIAEPAVAVIGLIGALAGSRYLNNKERMLLLDEIEIELKVVEKELQKAENDDDMAKYRRLLTYKKRLEKESFKLRYNISRKMGKDYLTKKDKEED